MIKVLMNRKFFHRKLVLFKQQVVAKPKGVHTASDKPRSYSKISKLPPRFARQREQQRGEKGKGRPDGMDESEHVMSNIENWDNELANNIPPLMSDVISADIKQQGMTCNCVKRLKKFVSFSLHFQSLSYVLSVCEVPCSVHICFKQISRVKIKNLQT